MGQQQKKNTQNHPQRMALTCEGDSERSVAGPARALPEESSLQLQPSNQLLRLPPSLLPQPPTRKSTATNLQNYLLFRDSHVCKSSKTPKALPKNYDECLRLLQHSEAPHSCAFTANTSPLAHSLLSLLEMDTRLYILLISCYIIPGAHSKEPLEAEDETLL
jgi:hypothetical protein